MFAWLSLNRWAIWLGAGLAAFLSWNAWLNARDRRIRQETEANIKNTIERQTDERIQRAREARDRIENQVTADLNRGSRERLRQQRANDPNNRSGVHGS
ncbi:MAG: hypothetical protein AAGF57_20230 [Pseudomonadota bacterium]